MRFFVHRKLTDDQTIGHFIELNTKRRIFIVTKLAKDFDQQNEYQKVLTMVSLIEQYVAATEDLMKTYWVLRRITEDSTVPPLKAYLDVQVDERNKSQFSTKRLNVLVRKATRTSFIRDLGLPQPKRIELLDSWLEKANLLPPNPTRVAVYENYIDGIIKFLRNTGKNRSRHRNSGGSLVNIYNKIKHGNLFFYDSSKHIVVFPVRASARRNWYRIAISPVDQKTIDIFAKEIFDIHGFHYPLLFLRLLADDPQKAINAIQRYRQVNITNP